MDIEPSASVRSFLRTSFHRIDGCAMYISAALFLIVATAVAIKNILSGDYLFPAWKIVIASLCMSPICFIIYVGLATYSAQNRQISRWANAIILVLIPIYFYYKLL